MAGSNVLFYAVIAFVTINVFLSFFLWRKTNKGIYLRILYFWLFNYVCFGMQFFFPSTNENEIILVYSLVNISTILAYAIYCELFKVKGSYLTLITVFLVTTVATLFSFNTSLSFTLKAMPYAISVSIPLLFIIWGIFFDQKRPSTVLEKFLGIVFGFWIIHSFNFAFFRMDAETQTVGWMTTYVLFDILGIILPAISIEEQSASENERLKGLVDNKTKLLSSALDEKELLLKILVHDISNPLTVMKWYLHSAVKEESFNPKLAEKLLYSQSLVEDLVKKVRLQQIKPTSANTSKISIRNSIEEMKFIFSKQLEEKNLSILIEDYTNGEDFIFTDQSSFNHNVLSNFTSNAIKFSPENEGILFSISKRENSIELTIQDNGIGMTQDQINEVMNSKQVESKQGTSGEKGSGLGLGIARSVLYAMGASFEIGHGDKNKGTKISILFPVAKDEV